MDERDDPHFILENKKNATKKHITCKSKQARQTVKKIQICSDNYISQLRPSYLGYTKESCLSKVDGEMDGMARYTFFLQNGKERKKNATSL